MNQQRLMKSLELHEGIQLKPYKDTEGFWTIGIGNKIHEERMSVAAAARLFSEGITKDKAYRDLKNHTIRAEQGARAVVGTEAWTELSDVRQEVLAEMVYQMGASGLAKFYRTMALVRTGQHEEAAIEMLDSKWAGQTPQRAATLSERYRLNKYES